MRTLALITALVAVAGCKKTNGAYCDSSRPCPGGQACDLIARECLIDNSPGDMAMPPDLWSGCAPACSGDTPICIMPSCIACTAAGDPEGACASMFPMAPHCSATGACVGCRDANDCTGDPNKLFCDATTHVCRGCATDAECPSLVCDLTPGSTTRGQCIPMSNVVYVDVNGASGNTGLTPDSPLLKIQEGFNKAISGGVNRTYVRVAAGTYPDPVGTSTKDHPLYLVGAPGMKIATTGGDALGVSNGASLTVRNVVATANANVASCQGTTNNQSKFTAYASQFLDSQTQAGVYSDANCFVTLDGVWVNNNATGVTVGGSFIVINSILTNNKGTGGFTQMSAGSTQIFVNNTVANNPSVSTVAGGVTCVAGGPTVVNSILYGNTKVGGGLAETNCSASYVATDDPSLATTAPNVDLRTAGPGFKPTTMPLAPDSYHLQSTSVCRDAGTTMSGAPDHDFDFQQRPDKAMMKVDIGADEL